MWYQLTINHCPREQLDLLSDRLEEAGALSITLMDKNDEPILEPEIGTTPVWRENVIHALFSSAEEAHAQLTALSQGFAWVTGTVETIEDQDWERVSMDLFQPQAFGDNTLWICPSWITPPEPDAVNVILDPGLAFGTGTHPTTSLCLTWLAKSSDLGLQKVVDFGCGSGILAIAALKLGAAFVQAVDLDEQALQATQSNAAINQINPAQIHIGFPNQLTTKNDLVIANILLGPLKSLKQEFKRLLNPHGRLVVSGLLKEQMDELVALYQPDFTLEASYTQEDWALLSFTLHCAKT